MIGLATTLDLAEFNRRAAIALRGVTFAPHGNTLGVVDSYRRQLEAGAVSEKMQQAIYNIVHRYRRQITDRAVLDYAAARAKGAD